MSTLLPFRYPLDPTGVSPDNRIAAEAHTLPNRTVRAFAPLYGAFFAESLIIRDRATGQTLNSSQYRSTELFEFPTGRYGKEICGIVLITDTSVSSNIEVDYQVLGGEYSTNTDAIVQMLNSLEFDNRPVRWPDIIGKPDAFEPAFHYHDVGDVYGFEYVVHAIERVRTAILVGDSATHDAIYRYIDQQDQAYSGQITAVQSGLNSHVQNQNNPHNTTKAQVGLGNVDNFATATTVEAQGGTVNNKFMTPLRTAEAISTQAGQLINNHVNNQNNPHNVTKAQVGLGNVPNYGIASQAEAEQGGSNSVFMTPVRTAQAIQQQAIVPLNNFAARTDNPHQVNKTQVGLGNVPNYGLADSTTALQAQNTSFMTPYSSALLLATHANRTDNPHNVTIGQIGGVPLGRSIAAGNGLTGGGDLSTNRTLALATPGTISQNSTNNPGGPGAGHTHAFSFDLTPGAIGTYIMAKKTSGPALSTGDTISGANLVYIVPDRDGHRQNGQAVPAGTWRLMSGSITEAGDTWLTGLFVRFA